MRIAWQTVIYYTWKERNQRIHKGKVGIVMQTVEQIKDTIRIQLIGLKNVKVDVVNFTLYRSWNLPQSIFFFVQDKDIADLWYSEI